MKPLNVIAIDYTLGFPIIGDEEAEFIKPRISPGLMGNNLEKIGVPYKVYLPKQFESLEKEVVFDFGEQSVLLSRDHMMTYFGLLSCQLKDEQIGLIVLDQHLDLYSYQTHGEKLNKSNVFRYSYDRNLLKYFHIIGPRDSEVNEFDDFHRQIIQDYDKVTNGKRFAGFEGIAEVVPAGRVCNLFDELKVAIDELNSKGIKKIGIDIDLDCFDTTLIQGVQFNERFPDLVRSKIGDYSADFIANQLLETGLNTEKLEDHIEAACLYLKEKDMQLVYRGITEYEPESDSNGKTFDVINQILSGFEKGL